MCVYIYLCAVCDRIFDEICARITVQTYAYINGSGQPLKNGPYSFSCKSEADSTELSIKEPERVQ